MVVEFHPNWIPKLINIDSQLNPKWTSLGLSTSPGGRMDGGGSQGQQHVCHAATTPIGDDLIAGIIHLLGFNNFQYGIFQVKEMDPFLTRKWIHF